MAAIWTLEHTPAAGGSSTTKDLGGDPFASPGGWGFHIAKRVDRSLTADTVDLELVPEHFSDDTEPRGISWVYGDKIKIFRDGTKWFDGEISTENRSASESNHLIGWTISGPWQALEEVTYYQSYGTTKSDGLDPPSEVITEIQRGDVTLMQRYDFATDTVTAIKTGEQISDLLIFAAPLTGTAAVFQSSASTVFTGINVAFVDARDETVANLIRKIARWHPRVTSRVDYTTSPPTIYIEELGAGEPALDVNLATKEETTEVDVTPNPELQVPYAKIGYKSVNTVDIEGSTQTYEDVTYDVYPVGADATATDHRRALRATVDLAGADASVQVQRVRTRTIPESLDDASTDPAAPTPAPGDEVGGDGWKDTVRSFWSQEDRLPWLKDIVPTGDLTSNIGVVSHLVAKADVTDANAFPVGDENPTYDLWETPRALDTGSTTEDWMGVDSQRVVVSCKLIFKGGSRNGRNVRQHFTGVDDDTGYPMVEASVTLTATSAVSKSYERTTSQTEGETPPTGIAQKLYDDLAILKNTGTIRFEVDELPTVGTYYPGQPVNITNSQHSDWATMRAQVQQVSYHLPTRQIVLTIGAPSQLGLNDFVTLARLWRANPPSFTTEDERKTGKPKGKSGKKAVGGENQAKNDLILTTNPRDPLVVTVTPDIDPGTGYQVFVEPGYVTTDRPPGTTAPAPPIMPNIDSDALDDDPRPKIAMAASETKILYAKHEYHATSGQLEEVTLELAASLPADAGGIGDPEHLEIATITTDTYPKAAVVVQPVEGGYYWPCKFDQNNLEITDEFHRFEIETDVTKPNCFKLVRSRYWVTCQAVVPFTEEEDPEEPGFVQNEWWIEKCFDKDDSTQTQELEITKAEFEDSYDEDCEIIKLTPVTIKLPKNHGVVEDDSESKAFKLCDQQPDDYPDQLLVAYSGSESTDEEVAAAHAAEDDASDGGGIYDRVKPDPGGVITYQHQTADGVRTISKDGNDPANYDWSLLSNPTGSPSAIFYNTGPTTAGTPDSVTGSYKWNSVTAPHGASPFEDPTLTVTEYTP